MSDRVLVIDDSLPVHKLLQSYLSEEGIDCLSAYDGERGVTLAAAEQPGLILLDVDLPNANGFEVCEMLRSNTRTARIPVMFLTADFNTGDKIRGLELGAVDYITKPCNFNELTARVKAALRSRRVADEQAMRDTLTGLWSKAYLDQHLVSRISLARRAGQPLSCIVCDVDNLARINKQFGQGVGDDVLCIIANALSSKCTLNDVACVLRGGTFAVLGFGSDRHVASRLAARHSALLMRELSERLPNVGATCSFGVADTAVASGDSLIERACAAMRRAKVGRAGSVSVARPNRQRQAIAA